MNFKGLLAGIVLLIIVGLAGFFYRNALERPVVTTGACTTDAKICPDGSAVGRVAPDCNFATCPPPNVTVAGVIFALPTGYASTTLPDSDSVAAFSLPLSTSSPESEIVMKDYPIPSGEAASDVMHATAIGDTSGAPVSPSAFSAATLGGTTYSTVVLGRFEGTVHVAYYLPRQSDVLRFDAIDQNVANWDDPNLDLTQLPTNSVLRTMLTNLESN